MPILGRFGLVGLSTTNSARIAQAGRNPIDGQLYPLFDRLRLRFVLTCTQLLDQLYLQ